MSAARGRVGWIGLRSNRQREARVETLLGVKKVSVIGTPTCGACYEAIRWDDSVYFWRECQMMEHIDCFVLRCHSDLLAEMGTLANGPVTAHEPEEARS